MNDTGEWRLPAGADIGRSAGDGAGGGQAAEERRSDIGDPLGNQFCIRAMFAGRHPVGHHRREERLHPCEEGDDKRRWEELLHPCEREVRQFGRREGVRQFAKPRADRVGVERGYRHCKRDNAHRNDQPRQLWRCAAEEHDQGHRDNSNQNRLNIQ